jgi:hypothetical protein
MNSGKTWGEQQAAWSIRGFKRNMLRAAVGFLILAAIGVGIIAVKSVRFHTPGNESAAAHSLKVLHEAMLVYKRRGYSGSDKAFPVGNDQTVINSGKYCGLHYQLRETGSPIDLIFVALANADVRAGDLSGTNASEGSYIQIINDSGQTAQRDTIRFERKSFLGYWFALMEYYKIESGRLSYDREWSRDHFAIVAFPDDYGSSGEATFIINEEGTVYTNDFGKGEYIDTYPGPDPTNHGWEIVK